MIAQCLGTGEYNYVLMVDNRLSFKSSLYTSDGIKLFLTLEGYGIETFKCFIVAPENHFSFIISWSFIKINSKDSRCSRSITTPAFLFVANLKRVLYFIVFLLEAREKLHLPKNCHILLLLILLSFIFKKLSGWKILHWNRKF